MASTKQKKRSVADVMKAPRLKDRRSNPKVSKATSSRPFSSLMTSSKGLTTLPKHSIPTTRVPKEFTKGRETNQHLVNDENVIAGDNARLSKVPLSKKDIPQKKRSTKNKPASTTPCPENLRAKRISYDINRHYDVFPEFERECEDHVEEENYDELNEEVENLQSNDEIIHDQLNEEVENIHSIDEIIHDSIDKTKKKTRGPSNGDNLIPPDGTRWFVELNSRGQPVGDGAWKLGRKIGILARIGNIFPINTKWKLIPESSLDIFWDEIEAEYDFQNHPEARGFAIKSLHDKWKKWKNRVKEKYNKDRKSADNLLCNRPLRVEEDQWAYLLQYWETPEAKKISEQNRKNRLKKEVDHSLGAKSIAQKEYEMQQEDPDVEFMTVYKACYTKRDGTCIIASDMEKMENLAVASQSQKKKDASSFVNLAPKVFGKEHGGYVRGIGLGVCKRDIISSRGQYKSTMIKKLAEENKALKDDLAHYRSQMDQKLEMLTAKLNDIEQNGANRPDFNIGSASDAYNGND